MREVAIRGFINEKFNTTYGKGLFRRAIYNGSVELRNPNLKYLVDFYSYDQWEASAKTDKQISVVNKLRSHGIHLDPDMVVSWIVKYDPLTKSKTAVNGYCVYSQATRELHLSINDDLNGTNEEWGLGVHHCTSAGVGKPVFIATNVDLQHW